MTPDDTRAARRIVNLWLDGIGIHIAAVEIERLHTIAAGVIAQERRTEPEVGAVELLRRVVMDYVPNHCDEGCVCSAAAARRYLAKEATP